MKPTLFVYLYRGFLYVGCPTARWLPGERVSHGQKPIPCEVETVGCWPCVAVSFPGRPATFEDLLTFAADVRWRHAHPERAYELNVSAQRCDGLHVPEPEAQRPLLADVATMLPSEWGFDDWKPPPPPVIGVDGRCSCDAATTCPIGRRGGETRCSAADLDNRGVKYERKK